MHADNVWLLVVPEVIILQWMRICTYACVGMNQGPYLGSILCYMFQQATFRSTMLTHLVDFNVCTRMMQSRSKLRNARVTLHNWTVIASSDPAKCIISSHMTFDLSFFI